MRIKIAILFLFMLSSATLHADLLVIVNANNSLESMAPKQAMDLFMGRVTAFDNGHPAQTLDLRSGAPVRANFYKALTGQSEAQVDAYWATLIFAGKMSPPKQFSDHKAIIEAVANNPHAIAYVPRQPLPPSVKVVMELATDQ